MTHRYKVTIRQRILWAVQDTISVMSIVMITVGLAMLIGEVISL